VYRYINGRAVKAEELQHIAVDNTVFEQTVLNVRRRMEHRQNIPEIEIIQSRKMP